MAEIPEKFRDLFAWECKALAHVATVMDNGKPQVTPVWYDYENGKVRINSARGRVKDKTMHEGVWVALSIVDPEAPYRYVQVRGPVTKVTEEGARAHIDHLSHKYLDRDYPFSREGEVRVIYEIDPQRVQTMG